MRVVQGENAAYATGSRATAGVTVRVSDETSKPVDNATVSFELPDGGPGGLFEHSKRIEIVTTKSDGVASVWGMQWNKTAGAFEIKVTAAKGQARAGLVIAQLLKESKDTAELSALQSGGEGVFAVAHHSRTKWLLIGALAVGAGAAAEVAFRGSSRSTAATAAGSVPLQIGTPTLIVGQP